MARNTNNVVAPSGVTVTRSGNNYTVTWKRGSEYSSQYMSYVVNSKITPVSISSGATSKVITINKNLYYPKTNLKMNRLFVHLKGKLNGKWSAGVNKTYAIWNPQKPVITATLSSEYENTTVFDWKIDWDHSNNDPDVRLDKLSTGAMFTNYKWWTVLLPNSELESEQVTSWQETGVTQDNVDEISKSITESEVFSGDYSYTRYIKVVARGPKGDSKPAYAKHVYAIPNAPKNVKAEAVPLENGSGHRISVQWTADESKSRPIDSIYVEYAIEKPVSTHTDSDGIRKITLSVPNIQSWTTISTTKDSSSKDGATDGISFVLDQQIPEDNWVFVRVVAKHDNKTSPSETVFVDNGNGLLTSPSNLSATISNNIASVTVTNNSEISESVVGIYYRSDVNTSPRLIGLKPAQSSSAISVQLPDEGANQVSLGVKAFLANYSPITPSISGVTEYAISNILAESDGIVWDERPVPKPPSNIGLSSPKTGVVRITWDWTWTDANGVEISWSDHDDAWESTDEPTVYNIENQRVSAWNIYGLDVGTWYFKIRLYKIDVDSVVYGTYSDVQSIKLASTPETPVLTVSPSAVLQSEKITCYWAFTATDGDEQIQADICEATVSSTGVVTYGDIVARANNEQFKTLSIDDLGWLEGTKHYLAVRIVTASGEVSNNWSVPKPIQVVSPITASIDSTSLVEITIIDDPDQSISHTQLSLTEMPLSVSASGAGEGGVMTYILERASDYHLDRPDESTIVGFQGETVAIIRKTAENINDSAASYDISIGNDDLIGYLDDGASYNLIAIAEDSDGRTASDMLNFEVHWSHKAVTPTATIEVDNERIAVYITPIQPSSGYILGDTCDVYRLSVDKPELILEDAVFGTKYVDPFPTLGDMGGYRIVYKTGNKDYITATNSFAWTDYDIGNEDALNIFATIIDFGDDRIVLPYDLSLSNRWVKDFTLTKYLGGSIEGDWNPAVERTGTIKTRVAVKNDPDLIESMRRLATYSGVCHVRTPDGSSFSANVEVSEDREERKINMLASFSLEITKVNSEGFDGITYSDWITGE